MNWPWKKNFEERQKECMGDAYAQLEKQLIGAIEIELSKYLWETNRSSFDYHIHFNKYITGGIDIWIYDKTFYNKKFIVKEETNWIIAKNDYEIYAELEHLHSEDLLWFIFNWKPQMKIIKKRIDKYFEWKEGK